MRPGYAAHRVGNPEGHAALEDITPHLPLRVLLAQPRQLRALVLARLPVPALPAAPVSIDPVAQGSRVDPRSRATCAIGLPVSRTSRTAPSRKSLSNFLRVSPIGEPPFKRISPRWEGKPKAELRAGPVQDPARSETGVHDAGGHLGGVEGGRVGDLGDGDRAAGPRPRKPRWAAGQRRQASRWPPLRRRSPPWIRSP